MLADSLISQLDDFNYSVRRAALEQLAPLVTLQPQASPIAGNVNMHFHSFFSYNAEGWSPSHIAFEARKANLYAAGLCDFDVLDGLEEFWGAGQLLNLRVAINLETRAFLREYRDVEINSPGEPGVTYIMGAGFAFVPEAGTPQAEILAALRQAARQRNIELVERINRHLPDIAIDYARDVTPLTPSDNATERHIVRAYLNKSVEIWGEISPEDKSGGKRQGGLPSASDKNLPNAQTLHAVFAFWAEILDKTPAEICQMWNTPALEEAVRAKLAKQGGLGYVQPSEHTFPPVEEFIQWVRACRAIPLITWLDGLSEGEKDTEAMFDCLMAKGCAGLNIIPDRNWNYSDPEIKNIKVNKLREVVAAANARGLPINIGTEMNKKGQPFVDDLSGEVLREFRESFIYGAQIIVGHSILLRYANISYIDSELPIDKRNAFFAAVGALPPLSNELSLRLQEAGPQRAEAIIHEAVKKGIWQ